MNPELARREVERKLKGEKWYRSVEFGDHKGKLVIVVYRTDGSEPLNKIGDWNVKYVTIVEFESD